MHAAKVTLRHDGSCQGFGEEQIVKQNVMTRYADIYRMQLDRDLQSTRVDNLPLALNETMVAVEVPPPKEHAQCAETEHGLEETRLQIDGQVSEHAAAAVDSHQETNPL